MGIYEKEEECLEELRRTYRQIVSYLDKKVEERKLTAFQRWVINETMREITQGRLEGRSINTL